MQKKIKLKDVIKLILWLLFISSFLIFKFVNFSRLISTNCDFYSFSTLIISEIIFNCSSFCDFILIWISDISSLSVSIFKITKDEFDDIHYFRKLSRFWILNSISFSFYDFNFRIRFLFRFLFLISFFNSSFQILFLF